MPMSETVSSSVMVPKKKESKKRLTHLFEIFSLFFADKTIRRRGRFLFFFLSETAHDHSCVMHNDYEAQFIPFFSSSSFLSGPS